MALQLTSSPNIIYTAQGEFSTVSVKLNSDTVLTGSVIRVNTALWLRFPDDANSNGWQVVYPAATGASTMGYSGDATSKNYEVQIEILDAFNFFIHYKFFSLTDLDDFLIDSTYDNWNILSSQSVNKNLVIEVSDASAGQAIDVIVPMTVEGFSQELSISTNGYDPNSDLTLEITSPSSELGNEIFVGWIRTDAISGSQFFEDDFELNYARATGIINSVESFDNSAFVSGNGFIYNGIESKAKIVIDSSTLQSMRSYRLYVVYEEDGQKKSYLSPEIVQTAPDRSQLIPTVVTQVTDIFGTMFTGMAIQGLSSCGTIQITAAVDKPDFASKLAGIGVVGTFDDFLVSTKAYISSSEPTEAYQGTLLASAYDSVNAKISVALTDESLVGSRWITFLFKTMIQGIADYNYVTVPLSFVSETEISPTFELGADQVEVLCTEEATYQVSTGITPSDCESVVTVNGSKTAGILANGNILMENLSEGDEVCVKQICKGTVETIDCICPECEERFFEVSVVEETPNLLLITLNAIGGMNLTISEAASNSSATGSNIVFLNVPYPQSSYSITVEGVDGSCEYSKFFLVAQENIKAFVENGSFRKDTPFIDCECEEEVLVCENLAWFDIECDEETGDITATAQQNFGSPIDTDVMSALTGNGTLEIWREVTFTDGCEPVSIVQIVTCVPSVVCENSLTIEYDLSDEGLLTLTENESFESDILSDSNLQISLDNGVTFVDYTSPVQLEDGDVAIWQREVIFNDSCDDITRSGNVTFTLDSTDPTGDCEGYDDYSIDVTYDEETSEFTVVKNGDETELETNELLWTLNGSDPFDKNCSGVPYENAIKGNGVFIAAWKIKLEGCPVKIIYGTEFGKSEMTFGDDCITLCPDTCISVNIKSSGEDSKVTLPQ